ncbi:glycoside hydrolase family 2 protein [Vibrio sp.]|nr:glycoside hydrolase family 2 protein [Vibrio sp.]
MYRSTSSLLLNGQWTLSSPDHPSIQTPFHLPGDVHYALLQAGKIPDPYQECNEIDIQWVGQSEWNAEREFELDASFLNGKSLMLSLSSVDTMVSIFINHTLVLTCSSQFVGYEVNILPYVHLGNNHCKIIFHRADVEAKNRSEILPFPIPWAVGNNQIPHMNLLRKTQCHSGWDWGICLLATGIYDSISLFAYDDLQLKSFNTKQLWEGDSCTLVVSYTIRNHSELSITESIRAHLGAPAESILPLNESTITLDESTITLDENTVTQKDLAINGSLDIKADFTIEANTERTFELSIEVTGPLRWWPNGYGEAYLYRLLLELGQQEITKKIGFRELDVDTQPDSSEKGSGSAMTFVVNGKAITAKGANWIPNDAMPSKQTPDTYHRLLQDAQAANMNMIRVWGGGMYEKTVFYELCDELGLLVWQDLMFSCALYPSTEAFLAEVEQEVQYQVKRLMDHPSLALWCGDNEVIGAIGWYPESKNNREKYIVNYDRLNRELGRWVQADDQQRVFWPSSPCNGDLDFGDAWHDDNRGDMHFWDVWHSGQSFDAFYHVQPRFCSEFGYQSWPSLPTVKTFAKQEDWNVTSPTFEQHQKNGRGNSIITEMFTRYFRFPNSFDNMLYLSQVQQALAIKTASEYWLSRKPVCRGILYWQLNDCWPVSSWSSIEYTGRWKQLHYHAKRFFAPQSVVFVHKDEVLTVSLINDAWEEMNAHVVIRKIDWQGQFLVEHKGSIQLEEDSVQSVWELMLSQEGNKEKGTYFYHVEVTFEGGRSITNTYVPVLYKQALLQPAEVTYSIHEEQGKTWVVLDTDKPALFVHLEYEGEGRFSDSSVTLLPSYITGSPMKIEFLGRVTPIELQQGLRIYHLRETY